MDGWLRGEAHEPRHCSQTHAVIALDLGIIPGGRLAADRDRIGQEIHDPLGGNAVALHGFPHLVARLAIKFQRTVELGNLAQPAAGFPQLRLDSKLFGLVHHALFESSRPPRPTLPSRFSVLRTSPSVKRL